MDCNIVWDAKTCMYHVYYDNQHTQLICTTPHYEFACKALGWYIDIL